MIQLRPYQIAGVAEVRERFASGLKRVLYVLPTGGGKSLMFSYIAAGIAKNGKRVCIVAHREELLDQISKSLDQFNVPHAVLVGGTRGLPSARVLVASVFTLVRRLSHFVPPDALVTDECFPAGTMVGGRPIERLRIGDLVSSLNSSTGMIEERPVTRLFSSAAPEKVVRLSAAGGHVVCTLSHPVYVVGRGWTSSRNLIEGDVLYAMHGMRKDAPGETETTQMSGVLPQGDGGEKPQGRAGENADEKPNEARGQPGEDGGDAQSDRPQAFCVGWQRTRSDRAASDAGGGVGLADRVGGPHGDGQALGIPDLLQIGRSQPGRDDRHRGGRRLAPVSPGSGEGREKDGLPAAVRLDRIEVLEQGNTPGFERLCSDGRVYNIEVEGNHNYFANGILVHNCHHSTTSTTWGKIQAHCKESFQLGVTASPCRLDGRGLGDCFDTMVLGPSISELTEQGFLVPAEVYAPPSPVDMTGVRKVGGDYAKGEVAARMDKAKITGDAVDHYRRLANGKAAVAFCCSIKHAEAVADQFRGQGIRAASIDGKMEKADRKGRIDALRSREIQVLTSCDVISEGLDIPLIEVGILLRPTESLSLYLQQIGRCLRPYPGKRFATILDHVGNSLKFGLPDEPRDWQLSATESSESEKKGLALRTCPKCLAIFRPAPECPRCGAPWETQERQVQQVAGELEKVTKEDREAARLAANREVQEARDRKALEAIAAARGYKGQWVDYVLAARAKKSVRPPIHESGTIAQWKGDEPT